MCNRGNMQYEFLTDPAELKWQAKTLLKKVVHSDEKEFTNQPSEDFETATLS